MVEYYINGSFAGVTFWNPHEVKLTDMAERRRKSYPYCGDGQFGKPVRECGSLLWIIMRRNNKKSF